MRATIEHESRGRMRLRLRQKKMTLRQADLLEAWLKGQPWARDAVVHERTGCVIVTYAGDRETVLSAIGGFTWAGAEEAVTLPSHSTRALNREFQEKLVGKVLMKGVSTLFFPTPLRIARVVWHMIPFLSKGLRCLGRRRIKVELLDALSIGISAFRRDFGTAGTVMFLLEIGELLEDWTRKKSVADLAESLSLHVDRVWLKTPAGDVLTPIGQIRPGDQVVVRAGGVIPLDGVVAQGEATINQASLTGESVPVAKRPGSAVYAGTVVEEGECILDVKQASGQGRYDQIVEMIQRSEQMKSATEAKASNLADKLVPYTFAGSLLSLALTRNVTRALSVLMVDFSCALKLAMPLAVLSAMREAGREHITVKGGKFLEAVAKADTIVFDKTGTLTTGHPEVAAVRSFTPEYDESALYALTASVEARSEHPLGKAVVAGWRSAGGELAEAEDFAMLPGRGVSALIGGQRVLAGNSELLSSENAAHGEAILAAAEEYRERGCTVIYIGVSGAAAGFIALSDTLRPGMADTISAVREAGAEPVLLTGDHKNAAETIAHELGITEYKYECLPEDKLAWIDASQRDGAPVCMIGDGINDAPALKMACTGIAMGGVGSDIAIDAADIALVNDEISELPHLLRLSRRMMGTIKLNLTFSMALNFAAIILAMTGILNPVVGALVHNAGSVLVIINSAFLLRWRSRGA